MKKNQAWACIIDDDGLYTKLFKKMIETRKLCEQFLVFRNGKESIEYFESLITNEARNLVPDILFIDLNMPIMDGWEFIDRFAKIKNQFNKPITLYIVSSSINPADIDRAKALPIIKDYLVKPVHTAKLETIFSKSA